MRFEHQTVGTAAIKCAADVRGVLMFFSAPELVFVIIFSEQITSYLYSVFLRFINSYQFEFSSNRVC